MFKKAFSLLVLIFLTCTLVQAEVKKVAIIDLQKVISKSAQVQALKKEQDKNQKEIAQIVKKAGEEIKKEPDVNKKKALADKYEKQLKTKREANSKNYKTKLEAIDKSINATISQQAKAMGYDMVLTKGVVLYGGDDITEAVCKVVK